MSGKIILWKHTGERAVHDQSGRQIDTVEVDTGMKRIYHVNDEGVGRQIGFLHPNGFMHFIIPNPPKEFADWVKAEVERQSASVVERTAAPPPIADDDDDSDDLED